MNKPTLRDFDSLSIELAQRIETICTEFERSWQAGSPVLIEQLLGEVTSEETPALLWHLLGVELHYVAGGEKPPTCEDYARRFPEHRDLIEEAFRRHLPETVVSDPEQTVDYTSPVGGAAGDTVTHIPGWDATKIVPTDAPSIPEYEILEFIGEGGMGRVYKARHLRLNRVVALKVIRPGTQSVRAKQRFRREAEAIALLQHPNVVEVFDFGEHNGQPYQALEFCQGGTLAKQIKQKRPSPRDAAKIVKVLANAVQAGHQVGVIHRDLKPSNILLTEAGELKVTDFGLAKREDITSHTATGDVLGTPAYMPPEQAGSNERVSAATDVYGLGAILYELLTGRPPFQGDNNYDIIRKAVSEPVVPPRRLNPRVPRDLETICLKCLEKDPLHRFESAQELADELTLWQNRLPIRTRPIGPLGRFWRWCQRSPIVPFLSMTVLFVAVVSTIAGFLALGREIQRLQADLNTLADRSVEDTSEWVAKTAELKLRQISHDVELAARDGDLRTRLDEVRNYQVRNAEKYDAVIQELREWDKGDGRPYPAWDELAELQQWAEEWDNIQRAESADLQNSSLTWLVWGSDGKQLARSPLFSGTGMGDWYGFRSYFTGRASDDPREGRPPHGHEWNVTDGPRLSAVFLTEPNHRWVLAISAPVWSDDEARQFLGVVGLLIRLGGLLELPPDRGARPFRFTVLIDPRGDERKAKVIEHPFHAEPSAREREEGPLRQEVIDETVDVRGWPETTHISQDPFGKSRFGAAAEESYGGNWRTSATPVPVPGREGEHLIAVVREDAVVHEEPGERLRANLALTALAIIGSGLALLGLLWIIIARRYG